MTKRDHRHQYDETGQFVIEGACDHREYGGKGAAVLLFGSFHVELVLAVPCTCSIRQGRCKRKGMRQRMSSTSTLLCDWSIFMKDMSTGIA